MISNMELRGSTHTPTQQHEHGEQKTLGESHSSILLNIALGVGCIFNTDLSNIILGLILR